MKLERSREAIYCLVWAMDVIDLRMRRMLLLLVVLVAATSGCRKTESSSEVESSPRESAVSASSSFDPQKFISDNRGKWNKLGVPVADFIRTAHRDLNQAAFKYGGAKMSQQVTTMGKSALMFQASMGSNTMHLGNALGEQPSLMFYNPFTVLLLLTSWTWDGKITESHFTTGNYFLGLKEPALPFFSDFREERNHLGKAIMLVSRVVRKFYDIYPLESESSPFPTLRQIPQESLERKLLLLSDIISLEKKGRTTENSELLSKFQHALAKGDVEGLKQLISEDTYLNAEELLAIAKRNRSLVVINGIELQGKPRYLLMADPKFPSLWYYCVIGVGGKVVVNSAADLMQTKPFPKN